MMPSIPKVKAYPTDAVQCDGCGGHGCATCGERGWLEHGHPSGRLCAYGFCAAPLPPAWIAVYHSNACAFADALGDDVEGVRDV